MTRTFLISCFVFNPAPYQDPVIAVAVTPTARIMLRVLDEVDMVPGTASLTYFDIGDDVMDQRPEKPHGLRARPN